MNILIETLRIGFPPHYTNEQIVRAIRNKLLAESDWTTLPDAPTDKTAWTEYRQQLRDLPSTWGGSDILNLPVNPEITE